MFEFLYKMNQWLFNADKGQQETIVPNEHVMTQEQAIAKAKEVVAGEGWAWQEPIDAVLVKDGQSGKQVWSVNTNPWSRGSRAHVVLDGESGETIRAQYDPR